jgi:hypothetical protein
MRQYFRKDESRQRLSVFPLDLLNLALPDEVVCTRACGGDFCQSSNVTESPLKSKLTVTDPDRVVNECKRRCKVNGSSAASNLISQQQRANERLRLFEFSTKVDSQLGP